MEVRDLYCYQCSLQFDKKCMFNDHLSKVHGIVFDIKRVTDFQPSILSDSFIGNRQNNETEESKKPNSEVIEEDNGHGHGRIHRVKKTYSCKLCHKKFTRSSILKVHERTHTGEKPYSCKICDKKFTDSSTFKHHERIHTGKKPYSCKFCDKKFTISHSLKAHEKTHTG